jgi:hypothetical protein
MPQSSGTAPSRDAFQRLIDGLQTLIREHLALARVEAKEDLRSMGRDLALGAAGVPALATGYLLLMTALAFLLGVWLANWLAFGIVAVANLAGGAVLSMVCKRKLSGKKVELPASADELRRNREWLSSLKESTRPESKLPAHEGNGAHP